MANSFVIGTHAFLWFLAGSPRLGKAARAVLEDPSSELYMPAIVLAEACWIVERSRVPLTTSDLLSILDADGRIEIVPLSRPIVERCVELKSVNEMHDRQIVATALALGNEGEPVAILTKDANITASGNVSVVWS